MVIGDHYKISFLEDKRNSATPKGFVILED